MKDVLMKFCVCIVLVEQRSGRSNKQPPRRRALLSRHRLELPWPMVPIPIDEASRKWNVMDHDILVLIMKKLGNLSNLHYRSFFFCKSWMSAVLDSVFPPGNVLDLRPLTHISRDQRPYFLFFLKVLLSRPHQYTKLFFPEYYFTSKTGTCIAQRLPALKCLVAQKSPGDYVHADLLPYWPELNEANCRASLILSLGQNCKNIRRLDLYGRIGDDRASVLASCFPQLVHLSVQSCILSPNDVSIILQGVPNLTYLDTTHAFRVSSRICDPWPGNVMEWDEDEVRHKAAGVETYLYCARRYCLHCAPLYSPNIDVLRGQRSLLSSIY